MTVLLKTPKQKMPENHCRQCQKRSLYRPNQLCAIQASLTNEKRPMGLESFWNINTFGKIMSTATSLSHVHELD